MAMLDVSQNRLTKTNKNKIDNMEECVIKLVYTSEEHQIRYYQSKTKKIIVRSKTFVGTYIIRN